MHKKEYDMEPCKVAKINAMKCVHAFLVSGNE